MNSNEVSGNEATAAEKKLRLRRASGCKALANSLRRLFASALQPLARRSRSFFSAAVASLPETSLEFIVRLARAWLL